MEQNYNDEKSKEKPVLSTAHRLVLVWLVSGLGLLGALWLRK
jgi:hypothetical protein